MKKITLLLFIIVLFISCRKPVIFSDIPEIKLISFEKYQDEQVTDAAMLVFYFQDGEGDIGFDLTDPTPIFDSTSFYYFNFFCDYYEKQNGVYVKIDSIETANGNTEPFHFNGRLPRLSDLPEESIHGEIYRIIAPYYDDSSPYSDTIQLRFFIVDRKLNQSNVVVADMIRSEN